MRMPIRARIKSIEFDIRTTWNAINGNSPYFLIAECPIWNSSLKNETYDRRRAN